MSKALAKIAPAEPLTVEDFEATCAELGAALAKTRELAGRFDAEKLELSKATSERGPVDTTVLRQARRRGIGEIAPVNHRLSRAGIGVDRILFDLASGRPISLAPHPLVTAGVSAPIPQQRRAR
jgi:hypothetical protein